MKFISWNVNGIRACTKKGLADFLKKEKPDVFCTQETKAYREQCPEMWEDSTGYKESWHSAKRPGYSGVANFYKKELPKITHGIGHQDFDKEGRLLLSEYSDFYFINSYFPNGAASEERHFFKMDYLKKALKFLKKLDKKKPLILTGDINIAHQEIDIHDPVRLSSTSGFLPEERQWMDSLMGAGFVDAYRQLHPEKKDEYTWWSYRAGARQRNKGWRIDYFIVSKRIAKKIKAVKLYQKVLGSDHCPLGLDISL